MKKIYLSACALTIGAMFNAHAQNLVYPTTQTTGGGLNTIFGINAGTQNVSVYNAIFSWNAGASLTAGHHNLILGTMAGKSLTTGKGIPDRYDRAGNQNAGSVQLP